MEQDPQPEAYLVHVRIREIHPMLWRRFLVRSDSTLADLHVLLQIGFDWTDFHLSIASRVRTTSSRYSVNGIPVDGLNRFAVARSAVCRW